MSKGETTKASKAAADPAGTTKGDDGNKKALENKKTKKVEVELSEEDQKLKDNLDLLVQRLKEEDASLYGPTLESLRTMIRTSTSSMTSVPKPLKYLRPHYNDIKGAYEKIPKENQELAADIISVLAMTLGDGKLDCLRFRTLGSKDALSSWGHEYVRYLSAEIGKAYAQHDGESEQGIDDKEEKIIKDTLFSKEILCKLAEEIVPYSMRHNAEAEACDLLMEIDRLDMLKSHVTEEDYDRVCLYLLGCIKYMPELEDKKLLKCALDIFLKFDKFVDAMYVAIQMNHTEKCSEIFNMSKDEVQQKQLAFILARQQIFIEDIEDETLVEVMSNYHLNESFLYLARDLDVMDPKTPEDIYKSHLDASRNNFGANIDSARQNLASTFVNAFVNCGYGQDKIITVSGNNWLYKNKEDAMLSASASLGLILLWDVEQGLTQIDKFLYSGEDYIKAGALLACGIISSNIRYECDPALALLMDYVQHSSSKMCIGSIMGLGIAYAGSNREDVIELLLPALQKNTETNTSPSMEILGITSVALGMICVGTANPGVTQALAACMLERTSEEEKETHATYLGLGLALSFLGHQEGANVAKEVMSGLGETLKKPTAILVDVLAYAGTGNVLKIQEMLHICSDHVDREKEESDTHQSIAVIGIALIAMGEEIGQEMALRSFNHLLQYGDEGIRRAVPLALGLLFASNPLLSVLDTLGKFSHDGDAEVAHNSIFALGLVGCGTNNARIALLLRQLATFYHKDPANLFMTRIAQGFLHMGKGTVAIGAYHSNRSQLSHVAVASLMAVIIPMLDAKDTILAKSHYLLYFITPAIYPRMLLTFDENLKPLPVNVRVGQAIDVVGQAGKPKTITGFQTHTTPVLLSHGERAELATDEYIPCTRVLEGSVILKKNPDYVEKKSKDDK